jgi:putative transposase
MEMDSRSGGAGKGSLEELMRERIRATIEAILDEELEAVLGAGRSARVGSGSSRISAREAATNAEHQSGCDDDSDAAGAAGERQWGEPRVAQPDDPALPAADRAGGRSDPGDLPERDQHTAAAWRTIALALRGAPLSKDAVSRLVGRLREDFEAWAKRDLSELKVRYIFSDGWYPRVRIGKRRVRVPVLGHAGGMCEWPTRGPGPAAVRGRERTGLAGRGPGAGRAQPGYAGAGGD